MTYRVCHLRCSAMARSTLERRNRHRQRQKEVGWQRRATNAKPAQTEEIERSVVDAQFPIAETETTGTMDATDGERGRHRGSRSK